MNDHRLLTDVTERLRAYIRQSIQDYHLYPVATLEKSKIFSDLVRACKGESKKIADFRTHALCRRKNVLKIYGDRDTKKYLLKAGIVALCTDAAKHGYGTFDSINNIFTPTG